MSNDTRPSNEQSLANSLRAWADSNMRNAKYGPGLLRMAADEIERLQRELEAADDHLEDLCMSTRPAPEPADEPVAWLDSARRPRVVPLGRQGDDWIPLYLRPAQPPATALEPDAVVINDNQPHWTAIVETKPNVTLSVGTKLVRIEKAQAWELMAKGRGKIIADLESSAQPPKAAPDPAPPGCEDWWHLKQYGYASGGYVIRCHDCEEKVWNCDKRAGVCRPCAEKRHALTKRPEL